MSRRCPRCNSPHPHLHPAVQFEGEVQTCPHEYHLQPTNQNTLAYIDSVRAYRRELGLDAYGDGI